MVAAAGGGGDAVWLSRRRVAAAREGRASRTVRLTLTAGETMAVRRSREGAEWAGRLASRVRSAAAAPAPRLGSNRKFTL